MSLLTFALIFSFVGAEEVNSTYIDNSIQIQPVKTRTISPLRLGAEGLEKTEVENETILLRQIDRPEGVRLDYIRENAESDIRARMMQSQDSDSLSEERLHERKQIREGARERINGLLRGITNKFTNALSKLDNIEERLSTIFNDEDTEIIEMVDAASELKDVAKISVEEVTTAFAEELENEEGVSKERIKELVHKAQLDIKNAWHAFREVITEIKSSNKTEGADEE